MDIKQEIKNIGAALNEAKERGKELLAQTERLAKEQEELFQTKTGQRIILVRETIHALTRDSLENQKEQLRLEGELRVLKRLDGAKPKGGRPG